MTLFELYFVDISIFFWIAVALSLVFGTLIAKAEGYSYSYLGKVIIFGLTTLAIFLVAGILQLGLVYLSSYRHQTIVDLREKSVQQTFAEAGLNCLLKPHDFNHMIRVSSHNGFSSSVVFRDKTLVFFNLDSIHPKQSFKKIEAACIADLAAIKEQNFLNSVSKGGEK